MSKTHPPCSVVTTTGGPSSSSSSSPAGGSTSPATVMNVQPEKPQHYTYHKCTQHRPFSCFHWHFLNQRRRRPMRRRDGTFNYSPDVYCTKYDEGTGTCPDGDECPFLHRTAGDTERRYHLRYYKTGSCIHETDSKGHCSKNGSHCAFAHGSHDLRSPVYDIREVQVMECQGPSEGGEAEESQLCKKPPRLCRQGYACPYFHNSKDRRRSPHKHKYRALPCPAVKQSEEWGDPSKCEGAESCQYCHTRTEQQFHPEIYKSTKCNDMQQKEPSFPTPSSPPPPRPPDPLPAQDACSSPIRLRMGSGSGSYSDPFSPSAGSCVAEQGLLGNVLSLCEDMSAWAGEGGTGERRGLRGKTSPAPIGPLGSSMSSGMNANALPFYPTSETVESVVESALDDLDLNDSVLRGWRAALLYPMWEACWEVASSRVQLHSHSPSPPIRTHSSPFFSTPLSQPSQSESTFLGPSHSSLGLNGMSCNIWEHFPSGQGSPGTPPTLLSSGPCAETPRLKQELEEAQRALKQWSHSWRHSAQSWAALKADAEESRSRASRLSMESERAKQAEVEAQRQATLLQEALESLRNGENPHLALHQLQLLHRLPLDSVVSLQAQICSSLQAVEQVVYRKQRQCCVTCGDPGSVSLICGHGLQCESCSSSTECPLCPEQTQDQQLS
ncbi:hypothetical protein F7725_013760 [Dissostichus mawsoni]|uniref:C3H1-type domain-containing protein n=1 Tax=Dissostichus mawsoni TaxID=36200 RepID=A0A7J5YTY9_DISMA|nr:hypothetical protein F7725_013760 [Dissostichus mawsoni]